MTFQASKPIEHHSFDILPNMGSPAELAAITGGTWTQEPQCPITAIRHRIETIEDGLHGFLLAPELFSRVNGTTARLDLLGAYRALAKGAAGFIVSARPRNLDPSIPCLIVEDPTIAVEKLAKHRRAASAATFFAITGSVGKTTTKTLIHTMVSALAPAHRTIANYNDGMQSIHFVLSGLCDAHRYCVAEFSEVGDLEDQVRFYRPHVAVITNVKFEHINRMERQGYKGEKAIDRLAELAAGVVKDLQPGGICVLNADEKNFDIVAGKVRAAGKARIMTCGTAASNDARIAEIVCDEAGSDIVIEVAGKTHSYRLTLPGHHMAVNSVVAATAIHAAGLDLATVLPVLGTLKGGDRRGTRFRLPWRDGFITIRDESVSSSLPSLRSTIAQLEHEQPEGNGRRIAVFGQINGIGEKMPDHMKAFAREAEASSIDRFYTIGSDIRLFNEAIADRSRVAPHVQTLEQLERALRADLRPGDRIVFKGTRRPANIALRKLVDRLVASPEGTQTDAPVGPVTRLVIGGDTYFGEYYQTKRARDAEINYLNAFGYTYSSDRLLPLFRRADFSVVNLECALTTQTKSGLEGRKSYVLSGKPRETIAALRHMNVGGVLLGNNHAMDYLASGLEETLDSLEAAHLMVSGGGRGRMDAQKPILKTFDVGGLPFKTAIISGYAFNTAHEDLGFYAGAEKTGVNNINYNRLREQIAALRSDGYFTIVSPHWGSNYTFRDYEQSVMADKLTGCGADLILGHGPHMLNEIAQVNGVWVIYSLGNLIFNSEGEYERRSLLPYSLVAELELARVGGGVSGRLNLYPVVSCNQMTQFQPVFVDEAQFRQVVDALAGMSYDRSEFLDAVAQRKDDDRYCLSVKLF